MSFKLALYTEGKEFRLEEKGGKQTNPGAQSKLHDPDL